MKTPSSSKDRATLAADFAAERKADEILIMDLRKLSPMTDYFVLCNGRSAVHVKAICERVKEGLSATGVRPVAREGLDNGKWALLDYGDVVVHVFQPEFRELYDLEKLWNDAPRWTCEQASAIG